MPVSFTPLLLHPSFAARMLHVALNMQSLLCMFPTVTRCSTWTIWPVSDLSALQAFLQLLQLLF